MAEANNTGTGFKPAAGAEALLASAEGVSPIVAAGAISYQEKTGEQTTETKTTETQKTQPTQTQETQTVEQPAEGTTTEPDKGSQEGQPQEAEKTEQQTTETSTEPAKETPPERKFKFGDKEVTEAELFEWRDKGLRTADYGKKVEELAIQRKTFETQSAENLKVVDHANAMKDLANLIRNDSESKEELIARHGDKARDAIRLAEQYDPSKFVDTRDARLAEQDVTIKQNAFLAKADAEIEAFTIDGVTLTDSDRLAMRDIQNQAAEESGAILNAQQAYWQAKGKDLIGKSGAMTITEITAGTNGNGKPSSPTSVTDNHGTSMSKGGKKEYAKGASGDTQYQTDLASGIIDEYCNII